MNKVDCSMTNERKQKIELVLSKRQSNLTVVLENVFDPHNISAVMRSCDAVGIQEIYVLNTKNPQHKKWGARSSSSAAKKKTKQQKKKTKTNKTTQQKKNTNKKTTHLA